MKRSDRQLQFMITLIGHTQSLSLTIPDMKQFGTSGLSLLSATKTL